MTYISLKLFMLSNQLNKYFLYNKIKTGISGLDTLLYDGLVIPENDNLLIVIRGGDNTEKTIFGLQLISAVASEFAKLNYSISVQCYSNYLNKKFRDDLLLDMLIASAVRQLTMCYISGKKITGKILTEAFFDTDNIVCCHFNPNATTFLPYSDLDTIPDKMLCQEALYYNNRTNALHLRIQRQDDSTSTQDNLVYSRKHDSLNDFFTNGNSLKDVEELLQTKYVNISMNEQSLSVQSIIRQLQELHVHTSENLVCVNLVNRMDNGSNEKEDICDLIDELKRFRVSILVIRDDVKIPSENVGMVIDLTTSNYKNVEYCLNYLTISKSRFQTTALGYHQYKRKDYGIEVYPSIHTYCQKRRYLQRALVYTHSNVISETYQQYLNDNVFDGHTYDSYTNDIDTIREAYRRALSPSAYKDFSISQVLDSIFINPIKNKKVQVGSQTYSQQLENSFLYGNNGGITAIIGEPNTFKRFLTFGSAFSSAHKKEHTLFLLLNKDSRTVRRRLQCPAISNKKCPDRCGECYQYLHFMNIVLGCITAEEFIYFLTQQIDTAYPDGKITRVIIDDLQILEYCFPLLFDNKLFMPALIDECRDRHIALYIMCDKNSIMTPSLSVLADNVVYTNRDTKGGLELFVERYSGYNSTPSKIFVGKVKSPTRLFECYERGSRDNRRAFFDFDSDQFESGTRFTMSDYWKK